jgi:hypothetical protein
MRPGIAMLAVILAVLPVRAGDSPRVGRPERPEMRLHAAAAGKRLGTLKTRLAVVSDPAERRELVAEIREAERELARLRRAESRARRNQLSTIRAAATAP